jgi:hypothetical protein
MDFGTRRLTSIPIQKEVLGKGLSPRFGEMAAPELSKPIHTSFQAQKFRQRDFSRLHTQAFRLHNSDMR